mmetsp:Transcript_1504/g.3794  ORF Transcript_1504/g.3794 Transcript_1504/m.3794 type:complete len:289 (+) Transcript_1504:111-977(+)
MFPSRFAVADRFHRQSSSAGCLRRRRRRRRRVAERLARRGEDHVRFDRRQGRLRARLSGTASLLSEVVVVVVVVRCDVVLDDDLVELVHPEGLGQHRVRTALPEVADVLRHEVARDADDEDVRAELPDLLGGLRTDHDRHLVVHQHQIEVPVRELGLPDHVHGDLPVFRLGRLVPLELQEPPEELPVGVGVVDDQDVELRVLVRGVDLVVGGIVVEVLSPLAARRFVLARDVEERNPHGEGRSPPETLRVAREGSLVLLDDPHGDVQAETGPVSVLELVDVELDALTE